MQVKMSTAIQKVVLVTFMQAWKRKTTSVFRDLDVSWANPIENLNEKAGK